MEDNGMDQKVAAKYIGCRPDTLRVWRKQGLGPKFYRAGRLVRYRKADVDDWIERNSHNTEISAS